MILPPYPTHCGLIAQALTFAFYALPPTDRAVPYLWLGLTQKLLPLAPAQQHQLDLQVAFPTEGSLSS